MQKLATAIALTIWSILLVTADAAVLANGGQVRVANYPVGPYEVTVFTSPVPLTTGLVDVSVLLQRRETREIVDGATITLTVIAPDGTTQRYPVTREQATNRLYYAAEFTIAEPGIYQFQLEVRGPEAAGALAFEATVERASSPFWRSWWFWGVIGLAAVIVLWWLFGSDKGSVRRNPAPSSQASRRR